MERARPAASKPGPRLAEVAGRMRRMPGVDLAGWLMVALHVDVQAYLSG